MQVIDNMGAGRRSGARRGGARGKAVVAVTTAMLCAVAAVPVAYSAAPTADSAAAQADSGGDEAMARNLVQRIQDPRLGTLVSGFVLDAKSDKVIWRHQDGELLMPASNAKLFTSVAALAALGPNHRFTTRVARDGDTLTLVGGADRTLTTSDLTRMARTVAEALSASGVTRVQVRIDDSLFPAPTLAEGWTDGYYPDSVAPVRALVVDGRPVMDTALDAGTEFARQLAAAGVEVVGEVTRGRAGRHTPTAAWHHSAPLSDIVRHMVKVSDNNIAETLLRATALATGRPATFEGGVAAVRSMLAERYGIDLTGVQLHDGSGLSRANRVPVTAIVKILDLLQDRGRDPRLRPVLDGLPIAGEPGSTLGPEWGRFDDPDSSCALGAVHAKTGTLTGAIALSGVTRGADGRWKVFSFVENKSTAAPGAIKDAMDGLAATVNGCRQ
ncbi:D-alanyl-D-alanine carboxypeptidase/D-alanyl-D-alanine-endopeptidase (plasmid) [Streptomycetaceae bacterium NBC_01309]